MEYFWEHLMIDVYDVDDDILENKELIEETFKSIIKSADMKPLSDFNIYKVIQDENSKRDYWWVTAFQVINESHISIHTFKWIWFVSMDLYTCSTINADIIVPKIKDFLWSNNVEIKLIKRWLKFNKYLQKFLNK